MNIDRKFFEQELKKIKNIFVCVCMCVYIRNPLLKWNLA